MLPLSLMLAMLLAALHLLAERMIQLQAAIPRSTWLSLASGTSVAYVFVHIFPELGEHQEVLVRTELARLIQHDAYILSLIGFCAYYGIERAVQRHATRHSASHTYITHAAFWLHLSAFAFYYALIGYLLIHRDVPGPISLLFFALAMGMHFVVIDIGLSDRHRHAYHRFGRWILALAVLFGWTLGLTLTVHPALIAALFAFLAGGIILNAIKEELPPERKSRFWAFATGALVFGVILLLTPGV